MTKAWLRATAVAMAVAFPLAAAPKRPAWLTGADPRYPESRFVTGVGVGDDLDAARTGARAEIARTFQARVKQTLSDRRTESSFSRGKKRSVPQGSQNSLLDTQLTTEAVLEGVTIPETFFDKKSNRHYALAVLDKGAYRKRLTEQAMDLEQTVAREKSRASSAASLVEKTRALSAALTASRARDDVDARRRWVDPAGMGQLGGGSTMEIEQTLNKSLGALAIVLDAEGPEGTRLKETISAVVNDTGMSISTGAPAGLRVTSRLDVKPFDRGSTDWVYFRWSGTVEISDLETGNVVVSAAKDGVEGHLTAKTAEAKSLAAGESSLADETARLLSAYLFNQ